MKKRTIIIQLAVISAIVVVVSLISNQLYFRLDFTEDKRYTLSDATKDILNDLEDVITVTAYFSEDLPPQLLSNRKDFEDMLIEYEQSSRGNVVYEFVNPNEDQTKEQEVQQKGIGPIMINVTENDRIEQMRAYMGATLQLDDSREIIPLVQPGVAMEFELTTSIKKLSVSNKPKVAFIQGHGETLLDEVSQLRQQLAVLYDIVPLTMTDTVEIQASYRVLILVAPSDTIPASHLAKIDSYVNQGGKLFVCYSNVQGDLQTGTLSKSNDIGLVSWLRKKGVLLGGDFIIDTQCANVTVSQQQGFFRINSQKEFPYFPKISSFGDHPATKGLDEVTLTFATSVVPVAVDSAVSAISLVSTSPTSGVIRPPAYLDIQRKWNQSDFGMGVQSLGLALEGLGNGLGKIIVIGNGDFFFNGSGQGARQVAPDHVNLASNAIDWLADDTGLIDLRTKGITSRPLETIEDGTKDILKYGNVFAPISLLLLYAFVRRLRNQRRKQKWLQGNFE